MSCHSEHAQSVVDGPFTRRHVRYKRRTPIILSIFILPDTQHAASTISSSTSISTQLHPSILHPHRRPPQHQPPPGRSPSCQCRLGDSAASLPLQPRRGKCRRRRARRPVRSCIRSRIGGCCRPRRHSGPRLHLVQVPCYRTGMPRFTC